jgi:hypothetical protein
MGSSSDGIDVAEMGGELRGFRGAGLDGGDVGALGSSLELIGTIVIRCGNAAGRHDVASCLQSGSRQRSA